MAVFLSAGLCERNIQMPQVHPQGGSGWQEPRLWGHNCLLSALIWALSNHLAPGHSAAEALVVFQHWAHFCWSYQGPENLRGRRFPVHMLFLPGLGARAGHSSDKPSSGFLLSSLGAPALSLFIPDWFWSGLCAHRRLARLIINK